MLICSKYNKLRLVLLDSIQELIPKNNNADINIGLCLNEKSLKTPNGQPQSVKRRTENTILFQDYEIHRCPKSYRNILFYFCFDLSKEIFKAVQKYISDTHCFI
jgi:hypothetical protein